MIDKDLKEQIHKHHIIPKHAGGTNDLSNLVELTRLEHSWVHWWMWCNERKDVFNLLESKGVKITKEMIQHIPWQDRNDSGAASLLARGEIDGIDMSGKNHPLWKGGFTVEDKREYDKKYHKEYDAREEVKVKKLQYARKPENKAKRREYQNTPEYKARKKEYDKARWLARKKQ
jgi:hypothetical protein